MTTTVCQPKRKPHGTQEWAASNVNIQDGCEHDCRYCYAKTMAIRFKRATSESWKTPSLRQHDVAKRFTRRDGRIMFPTAHDITDHNIDACLAVLTRMLEAGNAVLIVSKPHLSCMEKLSTQLSEYRHQIVFRFSIGSANDRILKYWEPGAPSFKERLACLKAAYLRDFQTSVSGEPMLDDNPNALIAAVRPFVTDSIWIGKINRLRNILPFNCPDDLKVLQKGEKLMAFQNDKAIKALYAKHRHDPLIKWKDSIKAIVGLSRPDIAGLDV